MEATPRPWTFDPKSEQIWSSEGLVATVKQRGALAESDGDYRLPETEANGEFIVRAVNAHDRLVEALELAETWFMTEGTCPPDATACDQCKLERQIRAALALARGEVEA